MTMSHMYMAKSWTLHAKKCDFKVLLGAYDKKNLAFMLLYCWICLICYEKGIKCLARPSILSLFLNKLNKSSNKWSLMYKSNYLCLMRIKHMGQLIRFYTRSRRGVVDKLLALYTRGRRFNSQLHQSVGWDFKLWIRLHMTIAVGGTLNTKHNQISYLLHLHQVTLLIGSHSYLVGV